jgi:hypothetical protein
MRVVKASAIVLACILPFGLLSVPADAATVTVNNQQTGSVTVFSASRIWVATR